jgi:hypothetical protein
MDILTEIVKEKHIANYIWELKNEYEIIETKQYIDNVIGNTSIIYDYFKQSYSHDILFNMNNIINEEYYDLYELIYYANCCGYNININQTNMDIDDYINEELIYDIHNMVRSDYIDALTEYKINKKNFCNSVKEFRRNNNDIKITYNINSDTSYENHYLIFTNKSRKYIYDFSLDDIKYIN